MSAVATEPVLAATGSRSSFDLSAAVGWLLAVVAFVIGSRVIEDNSFLTHLATGRIIVESGSVPTTDLYSYSAAGEAWTVQSWLPSLLYAKLENLFGLPAIRLLNGLFAVVIVRVLWALSEPAKQLMVRVLLVGGAVVVGTFLWTPRPLMFGLLCLALMLLVNARNASLWWLLPIGWVWVNSHGSFPLALVFAGCVGVGTALDEKRFPVEQARFFGFMAAGLLLGGLNPLGLRLLTFPVRLLARREALDGVAEWSPPDFTTFVEFVYGSLAILIVLAWWRGARFATVLPALVFFVSGLLAVRNFGPASLVVVVLVAPWLADSLGTLDGSLSGRVPKIIAGFAGVLGAFLGLAILSEDAFDPGNYPVEEVDWLQERGLIANEEMRLLHPDLVGNYLTFRFGAEAQVFVDDRFDFYPQPVLDAYRRFLDGDGDLQGVLDSTGTQVVLWPSESKLSDWLNDSPSWFVGSEGEDWLVACRADASEANLCR